MIFVNAHAFAAQAVDNLVLAVECGSSQAANEERNGNGIGACRRGHSVAGNRKLVIADGGRGAASGGETPRQHEDAQGYLLRPRDCQAFVAAREFSWSNHEFVILLRHLCSPGTCSFGLLARISV